jgi:DNA-binding PadR family transcriptional regulator
MIMTKTSDMEAVLRYLRELEKQSSGFKLFGLRGWAPVGAISEGTSIYTVTDELRACVRRGFVEREDVRLPDAATPSYVYRITAAGARHIAKGECDDDGREIPSPRRHAKGKRPVLLSTGAVAALDALRHAASHAARRERVAGETGWRTSLDLTNWLKAEGERTGNHRVFFSDELQRLVRYGVVERRVGVGGEKLYRLTARGKELQPLEWK